MILTEKPFTLKTFTYGDIRNLPVDTKTSYRRIDGKLWARPIVCAASRKTGRPHKVPAAPRPPLTIEEIQNAIPGKPDVKPYPRPLCGKNANRSRASKF